MSREAINKGGAIRYIAPPAPLSNACLTPAIVALQDGQDFQDVDEQVEHSNKQ